MSFPIHFHPYCLLIPIVKNYYDINNSVKIKSVEFPVYLSFVTRNLRKKTLRCTDRIYLSSLVTVGDLNPRGQRFKIQCKQSNFTAENAFANPFNSGWFKSKNVLSTLHHIHCCVHISKKASLGLVVNLISLVNITSVTQRPPQLTLLQLLQPPLSRRIFIFLLQVYSCKIKYKKE